MVDRRPSTPPEDVTLLGYLWSRADDFRKALRHLLLLSYESILTLTEASASGFDLPPDFASKLDVSDDEFDQILRAARSLYAIAVEHSTEETLAELEGVLRAEGGDLLEDFLAKKDALLQMLDTPRPAEEDFRLRFMLQRSIMPYLETVSWTLDMRVSEKRQPDIRLAPVVIVRLVFDEPVAGGVKAVAFQLTDEGRKELMEALGTIDDRLEAVRRELGEHVL